MAVIQPILGDLVDGLAATNPPTEVASAHADLLEAERGVQGMLADLAEQLEQGEGGMEAFLAFTSDASSTALGQQLAAAASELQSIAATNDITLNLSAAGGTSSGSTQRPRRRRRRSCRFRS